MISSRQDFDVGFKKTVRIEDFTFFSKKKSFESFQKSYLTKIKRMMTMTFQIISKKSQSVTDLPL